MPEEKKPPEAPVDAPPAATPTTPPAAETPDPTEADLWAEMAEADGEIEKAKTDDKAPPSDSFAGDPENATDKPIQMVGSTAPAAPAAGAPEPTKVEAPDIWADADPKLKAAHDAQVKALESATTDHARRSIEGRIAAYARRLNELAAAPQPPKEEAAEDPLKELAADYPEFAAPVDKALKPLKDKISAFETADVARQKAADESMFREIADNRNLLEQRHPGWAQFLKDNGAKFGEWIVDQPHKIRQAAYANKDEILDARSAIATIDAFKQYLEPAPPPQPPPAVVAQKEKLSSRRAAQLAGSATPSIAATRPTVTGIPEDADEATLWKALAEVDPDEQKYRRA